MASTRSNAPNAKSSSRSNEPPVLESRPAFPKPCSSFWPFRSKNQDSEIMQYRVIDKVYPFDNTKTFTALPEHSKSPHLCDFELMRNVQKYLLKSRWRKSSVVKGWTDSQ
ncbi:uncharacterized protein Z518_01650 [Rhinocladiella mackenziei CBS 650.93]|uniref:Uncharacterized protein n=1 Tax=Rhinocladiella mackenziei CBS 650.93 TaxID=1442369 RepID=A0A0D2J4F8_9EURO|nr:uncharacterized protein Z518_01650 [Rhinocladiella mackenziei CBS 650.93]KIX10566.1 hypothetical protein Z518_01650 [Rhinocladiella mackenziei CBS 650.93]